jgi:tRNA1(Val) A37 N6-methylase TrmN6
MRSKVPWEWIALARSKRDSRSDAPEYPLEGTILDISTSDLLSPPRSRLPQWAFAVVKAWQRELSRDTMALSRGCSEAEELRDFERLMAIAPDKFLRLDERTMTRDVLMVGAPGRTHAHWTRTHRWRMATPFGDLRHDLLNEPGRVRRRLEALFDPANLGKAAYRNREMALQVAMAHLRQHYNVATAFPPCHARFLADRHLPRNRPGLVVDPCAGWGGRLVGTLLVPRRDEVTYVGVDPNGRNQRAYEALSQRVRAVGAGRLGRRNAAVHEAAFEDWIRTETAQGLMGSADLVLTSPPYFSAENYDPDSPLQSANRYSTYGRWREAFLQPLIAGAHRLLRTGGVFVLNIADVGGLPLEFDSTRIARECGFVLTEHFKLAMNITPGTQKRRPRHWVRVDGRTWKYEPVFCFSKPGVHGGGIGATDDLCGLDG